MPADFHLPPVESDVARDGSPLPDAMPAVGTHPTGAMHYADGRYGLRASEGPAWQRAAADLVARLCDPNARLDLMDLHARHARAWLLLLDAHFECRELRERAEALTAERDRAGAEAARARAQSQDEQAELREAHRADVAETRAAGDTALAELRAAHAAEAAELDTLRARAAELDTAAELRAAAAADREAAAAGLRAAGDQRQRAEELVRTAVSERWRDNWEALLSIAPPPDVDLADVPAADYPKALLKQVMRGLQAVRDTHAEVKAESAPDPAESDPDPAVERSRLREDFGV